MCGRFTNRYAWRELKELYDLTTPYLESNFPPRFNIAPTQLSFVVRLDGQGRRELVEMKWGLVPSWSRDARSGAAMINAKAETVASKPAYRAAFGARPCLVVADGFYEWKQLGPNEKQPWFITRADGQPFAIGGLWEWWKAKDAPADEKRLQTFTILTTEANPVCAQVHPRMPLMLAPEDWPRWLGTQTDRVALLRPFPGEEMTVWPVGKAVGNVRNTGPELVEPIAIAAGEANSLSEADRRLL